ncbi:hypothetical protein J2X65_005420, partial [Ancylobacter sp. 3268]|nr:hypothetical protein [Ancylobacter sp. 3268]
FRLMLLLRHGAILQRPESLLHGGPLSREQATPAPYIAAFHALFESPDSFQKACHAHAAEIHGDLPNYTDIAPVVQLGNVSVATLMADAKIISNFTNALAHTELDDPVKPLAWGHPSER